MPDDQRPIETPAELAVHPLAAIFPMMGEAELSDLADDIGDNGLIHPIILDATGETLVDGRNRLAACRLAKVEPRFERLPEGMDPASYIIASNVERRHLNAGQRAMAVAIAYPETVRTAPGRRSTATTLSAAKSVSASRLSLARAVLRFSRQLADDVMSGALSLDKAFELAKQHAAMLASGLEALRQWAPDLADRFDAGEMSEDDVWLAGQARAIRFRFGSLISGVLLLRRAAEFFVVRLAPEERPGWVCQYIRPDWDQETAKVFLSIVDETTARQVIENSEEFLSKLCDVRATP